MTLFKKKTDPSLLLAWVDVETTGLYADEDLLLEVGITITDELGIVLDHKGVLCAPLDESVDSLRLPCTKLVQEMHEKSGLWKDLKEAAAQEELLDYDQAKVELLEFLAKHFPEDVSPPMCGSSIHFDRGFLLEYMPELHDRFHYRNIDMSTVRELARRLNPRIFDLEPKKREVHRVKEDLEDSIAVYSHYFDNFLHVDA